MAYTAPDQAREKQLHVAANLAKGWQRLIGPALAVNLALFVYVLFEPIIVTRVAFLSRHEISLARTAHDLYGTDMVLFLVVFLFGIVAPGIKLLASAFVRYFLEVHQALQHSRLLIVLSKLSMTEIMLLAVLVVAAKGTGWGSVEIKSGLYFYVALVVGSFFLSLLIDRQLATIAVRTSMESR